MCYDHSLAPFLLSFLHFFHSRTSPPPPFPPSPVCIKNRKYQRTPEQLNQRYPWRGCACAWKITFPEHVSDQMACDSGKAETHPPDCSELNAGTARASILYRTSMAGRGLKKEKPKQRTSICLSDAIGGPGQSWERWGGHLIPLWSTGRLYNRPLITFPPSITTRLPPPLLHQSISPALHSFSVVWLNIITGLLIFPFHQDNQINRDSVCNKKKTQKW